MSTDNLQRLQVGLAVGTVPADVRDWLERGIADYLSGAGDLETCLNIKARIGKRNEHPKNEIRFSNRDAIIHRLARDLPGGEWERAGELVLCLREWRRLKGLGINPHNPRRWERLPSIIRSRVVDLMEVDAVIPPIPRSRTQLYKILTGRRD